MNGPAREGLSIEDLLPHRGPMLLIGAILEVDETHAVTLSTVSPDWPLADEAGVDPLMLVELAAQTAGVCNGFLRIRERGLDSDRSGWLVAVKRAEFFVERLPLAARIRARVDNTLVFDAFREVTGHLFLDDQPVAEVILQLYQG